MPAIIKIVINIQLIVMVLLLHQANGIRDRSVKHAIRQHKAHKVVPGFARDSIIIKWMNTEETMRRAYINLLKSLIPKAFEMSSNVSPNCTFSLLEYMNGINNMKTWAFQMLDATGKPPNGVVSGSPMAFGDYDACLKVEAPSGRFKGQYCYIESSLPLPERKILQPVQVPVDGLHGIFEPDSVFEQMGKMSRFFYSCQLRLTTCLPSTCSKEDIRNIYKNALMDLNLDANGINMNVSHCETEEEKNFTGMEIFIIILFSILIFLVVLGTLLDILLRNKPNYDMETAEKDTTTKAILCFSAYTNFIRLLRVDHNPDTLHVFHGLRVLSMTWIIWSHAHLIVSYEAFDAGYFGIDIGKQFLIQTVPCGFLAVETFFFMSSVLTMYICIRVRGRINVPLIFLKRYLRLTPTMMLVAAFFGIVGRFGSGPLWREVVADTLSKNCLERGWINLLYINNILYSNKTCLGWTWYLSTDTQMFIVCLYICIIMKRKPGKGLLATGLALFIGILLSIFSHVYYKLPPIFLLSYLNFDDWYFYAVKGYTQLHFHLPVCAVGIVVGYVLATRRGHIPKLINAIGWLLTAMAFLSLMLLFHKWNQGSVDIPGVFVSALFGSLHRFIWALCLAFITISCTWGYGGIVNDILCWEGFVPFGRLTYMLYLVHYGLVYISTGYTRQATTLDNRTLTFLFFNNLIISVVVAFVLGLFFESPITAMEKAFSDGKLKKQVQSVSELRGTFNLKDSA